ncbi:MAG: GNAT family N-acetyltransferase [Gaiellaceae bacterium]
MSELTLRPATPQDAPAILELWRLAGAVPSRTDDEASICSLIAHDPRALVVAERAGRLVGSLVAGFDGWRGSLFRLAVLPEHRRSGIGRALVASGERSLRERGAARINLYAVKREPGAVEFWDAVGYAHDDRTRRFVKNLL